MKIYFHKNQIERQLGVKAKPGLSIIKQDPKVRWLDIPEYLEVECDPKGILEEMIIEMEAWMEVHMEKDKDFTTNELIKHMENKFLNTKS